MVVIPERSRLCLLRHGTTPWNREGRFLGHSDVGLDDEGRRGLAAAAAVLAEFAPQRVIVSPARRARETVDELGRLGALDGIPTRIDPDARELGFGRFEALTRAEIARGADAEAFERWLMPEHGFPAAPDGEGFTDAAERAGRVLRRVRDGERTLIVSHGYLLKILLATAVAGEEPGDVRATHMPNGVPVFLERDDAGRWRRSTAAVSLGA